MANTLSIGGVTCAIHADSGVREAQPETGPAATVAFTCDYDDRYALVQALTPQSIWSAGSVVRTPGFPYPPSPNLQCVGVSDIRGIAPWTDSTGWLHYRRAIVTAEFRIPTYQMAAGSPGSGSIDPSGLAWTTTTFEVGAEVLKVPGGGYVLSDGTPLEETVRGILLPQVTIRMKRHFMPLVPLQDLMTLSGSVNTDTITFANYTFPRGCLLLAGASTSQAVDTLGAVVTELDYVLIGRPQGIEWNQFLAPDGTWKYANTQADLSGSYPYKYKAIHTLP